METLSAERVFLTDANIKKIANAIRDKKPTKLKLRAEQTIGAHPLFLRPAEKKKLMKARIVGTGCMCNLDMDSLEQMAKKGKGLYMFNEGRGIYQFGQTSRAQGRRPPTIANTGGAVVTGSIDYFKPSYEVPLNLPRFQQVGSGLQMFGRGTGGNIEARSLTYGPLYLNHQYPSTFQ